MDKNEDIIRLLPKRKKGLLRIVFSRFFVMSLLILLQIILTLSFTTWLYTQFSLIYAIDRAFAFLVIFYLFKCEMDSTAKLTWLLILAVAPITGAILLLYTKHEFGHNRIRKRALELTNETKDMLPLQTEAMFDPEVQRSGTDDLCKYLSRTGCFPVFANTDATYFPDGEKKFEAMLEELQKAEEDEAAAAQKAADEAAKAAEAAAAKAAADGYVPRESGKAAEGPGFPVFGHPGKQGRARRRAGGLKWIK